MIDEVGEFVHDDHPQEFGGCIAEHAGDADFAAGLEPAALHAEIEKLLLRWEELMTAAEALQE